jgi:NACHT domain
MSGDNFEGPVFVPQYIGARRDTYVAGQGVHVTNNFADLSETPNARFSARVDRAADELAQAVGEQWQEEEGRRQIHDPAPMPLRWTAADPLLSDHAANILGSTGSVLELDGSLGEVIDVFSRIPSRRLVVIGPPGAGKTVFTMRFTLDLLARRRPGSPVPVIFGLRTWNPEKQSLHDWMAGRLTTEYPALGDADRSGRTVASELIRRQLILPVLDGLDEVGRTSRGPALQALNKSLGNRMPVIMTCREKDYRQIVSETDVLTAAAVIKLLPLTLRDLIGYLPRTAKKTASRTAPGTYTKWDPVLRGLVNHPQHPACRMLIEVLRKPLMTSLARSIYSDTPANPVALLDGRFATREEIEDHLLDDFVSAAFTGTAPAVVGRRRRVAEPEDAERWLAYLASHLNRRRTRDLEWWQLTQSLPLPLRWLAPVLLLLPIGVAWAAFTGGWLILLFICGYMTGLMAGVSFVTLRLWPARPAAAKGRHRVMLQRLVYAGGVAVWAGVGLAFLLTQDPTSLLPDFYGPRYKACVAVGLVILGLASGTILGASGFDASQAPTTTPLRVHRKIRTLSRRLWHDAGYGLLTGVLVGGVIWVAWGAGYAVATELRYATAPLFPVGSTSQVSDHGSTVAEYPGDVRLVIAPNGDRYAIGEEEIPDKPRPVKIVTFTGTINGRFEAGAFPLKGDCKYQAVTYDGIGGPRTLCTSSTAIKISDFYAAFAGFPVPPQTVIAWDHRLDLSAVLFLELKLSYEVMLIMIVAFGVTGALALWLGLPADTTRAISPASVLRTDRNAAFFRLGVIPLFTFSVISIFQLAQGGSISDYLEVGLSFSLTMGIFALLYTAWFRLQVARMWLAIQGKIPWRLMRFFDDAHACGALRQCGSVYQFRHIRLQERLAAKPPGLARKSSVGTRGRFNAIQQHDV